MADQRFYERKGPYTVKELVTALEGELRGELSPDTKIEDLAPLTEATPGTISYCLLPRYKSILLETKATLCLVENPLADTLQTTLPLLVVKNVHAALIGVADLFYPSVTASSAITSTAQIHPTAQIGQGVQIGDFVVIKENVSIGDNSILHSHAVIERGVVIGHDCILESHVTVSHALIGNRVRIKPGARIGQRGFGFAPTPQGPLDLPQLGRVLIEDDVEIGANTAIDRGGQQDTIIGKGCRIDNLVMLGHNVRLGDYCILVAQVGIAGSTVLGKGVVAGGQVGIAGHLTIGDRVQMAAKSGIIKDVESHATIAGCPAVPVRDWHKQTIVLSRLLKEKG